MHIVALDGLALYFQENFKQALWHGLDGCKQSREFFNYQLVQPPWLCI
jgi:hypothetical protein